MTEFIDPDSIRNDTDSKVQFAHPNFFDVF